MKEKFKDIIEKIESLSVLELAELVKVLEEKFGVSAAPTYAAGVVGAPTSDAEGRSVGEEKSAFNVELKSSGEQKIQVIKVLRDALGLGLKEAKDMADGAPIVVKEGMDKKSAEELKKKLEEAGGVVELK
ncbi:50S ribosomal protein L7/L12 [Patescibacteria group bacterium]|nr:50S ribosomal protein L7/L12 [Patescibacteria group bacterium]MBU2263378.1 50S ribosomal protein L7/L12 [Patescibacteria group bacterium]